MRYCIGGTELDITSMVDKEYKRLKHLRKIEILKDIPLIKWNKHEILDFLEHYILYFNKNRNSEKLLSMEEFLNFGEYKIYYKKEIEDLKNTTMLT